MAGTNILYDSHASMSAASLCKTDIEIRISTLSLCHPLNFTPKCADVALWSFIPLETLWDLLYFMTPVWGCVDQWKAKPGCQLLNWIVAIAYPITTSSIYLCLSGKRMYVSSLKQRPPSRDASKTIQVSVNIYIKILILRLKPIFSLPCGMKGQTQSNWYVSQNGPG